MTVRARRVPGPRRPPPETETFYRRVLTALGGRGTPFLVGGAYAHEFYTGIARDTKDLDLFIRERDLEKVLDRLAALGYRTQRPFPHWLAKIRHAGSYVDIIYNSGNGIAVVDDEWFKYARLGRVLGVPVHFCPPEEMIWSKAFIMERERFDGADILHLLRVRGGSLSWERLLARFGNHWPVLLAHLVLFGFVYPGWWSSLPRGVLDELLARFDRARARPASDASSTCQGTLLSRAQYLVDIGDWGLVDVRLRPEVSMTPEDIVRWTNGIEPEVRPSWTPLRRRPGLARRVAGNRR